MKRERAADAPAATAKQRRAAAAPAKQRRAADEPAARAAGAAAAPGAAPKRRLARGAGVVARALAAAPSRPAAAAWIDAATARAARPRRRGAAARRARGARGGGRGRRRSPRRRRDGRARGVAAPARRFREADASSLAGVRFRYPDAVWAGRSRPPAPRRRPASSPRAASCPRRRARRSSPASTPTSGRRRAHGDPATGYFSYAFADAPGLLGDVARAALAAAVSAGLADRPCATVEFWAHAKPLAAGHELHFDADVASGALPMCSAVVLLEAPPSGGRTVVTDRDPSDAGDAGARGGTIWRGAAAHGAPVDPAQRADAAAVSRIAKKLRNRACERGERAAARARGRCLLGPRRAVLRDLGLSVAAVDELRSLRQLEGLLEIQICAFVESRFIATLHDLSHNLCAAHGAAFEDLRLGPILKQPLVQRKFYADEALTAVPALEVADVVRELESSIQETEGRPRGVPELARREARRREPAVAVPDDEQLSDAARLAVVEYGGLGATEPFGKVAGKIASAVVAAKNAKKKLSVAAELAACYVVTLGEIDVEATRLAVAEAQGLTDHDVANEVREARALDAEGTVFDALAAAERAAAERLRIPSFEALQRGSFSRSPRATRTPSPLAALRGGGGGVAAGVPDDGDDDGDGDGGADDGSTAVSALDEACERALAGLSGSARRQRSRRPCRRRPRAPGRRAASRSGSPASPTARASGPSSPARAAAASARSVAEPSRAADALGDLDAARLARKLGVADLAALGCGADVAAFVRRCSEAARPAGPSRTTSPRAARAAGGPDRLGRALEAAPPLADLGARLRWRFHGRGDLAEFCAARRVSVVVAEDRVYKLLAEPSLDGLGAACARGDAAGAAAHVATLVVKKSRTPRSSCASASLTACCAGGSGGGAVALACEVIAAAPPPLRPPVADALLPALEAARGSRGRRSATCSRSRSAASSALRDLAVRAEACDGARSGQLQMLDNALKVIARDIYSSDSHFILELLQNADDNDYAPSAAPTIVFDASPEAVVVRNNERGFRARHKGIGFKSVFRVVAPEVHSSGYAFALDEHMVVPAPCRGPPSPELASWLAAAGLAAPPRDGTTIVLPLTDEFRGGAELRERLAEVDPLLLLFLNRVRRIDVVDRGADGETTARSMRRADAPGGAANASVVTLAGAVDGAEPAASTWLVVRREAAVVPWAPRGDATRTVLAAAFEASEAPRDGDAQLPVFAFLPIAPANLKFVLHADWILASSRETVREDSPWNQWLRDEAAGLYVDALAAPETVRRSASDSFGARDALLVLETWAAEEGPFEATVAHFENLYRLLYQELQRRGGAAAAIREFFARGKCTWVPDYRYEAEADDGKRAVVPGAFYALSDCVWADHSRVIDSCVHRGLSAAAPRVLQRHYGSLQGFFCRRLCPACYGDGLGSRGADACPRCYDDGVSSGRPRALVPTAHDLAGHIAIAAALAELDVPHASACADVEAVLRVVSFAILAGRLSEQNVAFLPHLLRGKKVWPTSCGAFAAAEGDRILVIDDDEGLRETLFADADVAAAIAVVAASAAASASTSPCSACPPAARPSGAERLGAMRLAGVPVDATGGDLAGAFGALVDASAARVVGVRPLSQLVETKTFHEGVQKRCDAGRRRGDLGGSGDRGDGAFDGGASPRSGAAPRDGRGDGPFLPRSSAALEAYCACSAPLEAAARWRRSSNAPAGREATDAQRRLGQAGEALAAAWLRRAAADSELSKMFGNADDYVVIWNNMGVERGLPYDIVLKGARGELFFEVKTTAVDDEHKPMEISVNHLDFARAHPAGYFILRVFAAREATFACACLIYKPMGSNGEPSLPDAMNWEGKMTVPKSWRAPASRCVREAPELSAVRLNTEEYYLAKYYQALGESEKIADVVERGDHLTLLQGARRKTGPDLPRRFNL
ncbi:hypothetical protein JL722_14425 [Aureococcus anophagefferens]|nr:hypothetical protein JL722_14425 [Aureococcus anophagefferens]